MGAEHNGHQAGGGENMDGFYNPSPRWIITDAAPYFTSREMLDFASRSGLGLITAPAEAHYLMGIEERTIQVIKRAVEKLEREDLNLGMESLVLPGVPWPQLLRPCRHRV